MNTRRNATRRHEKEIANAGTPPHGDQVPLYEEDGNDDQALVNPLPLMNEKIRVSLFQMYQAISTQAQDATTQAQAMTSQSNREVVP